MLKHPIGLARTLEGASVEQLAVARKIQDGHRKSLPSPFLAIMDSPALADAIQKVGVQLRFAGSLSDCDRELAILATAGAVGCEYEWQYHAPIAAAVGVDLGTIDATKGGGLADLRENNALLIAFCRRLAKNRNAPTKMIDEMLRLFGPAGTTEVIAIAGYYALLASFIFIGRHENAKLVDLL